MNPSAVINITLFPNGQLRFQITGITSKAQFLMMIETAKDDILIKLRDGEKAKAEGIEIAPADFNPPVHRQ